VLRLDCSEQPSSDVLGVASLEAELVGLIEDGQDLLVNLTVHGEQTWHLRHRDVHIWAQVLHHAEGALRGDAVFVNDDSKFRWQI
jgi:hypothetical protein